MGSELAATYWISNAKLTTKFVGVIPKHAVSEARKTVYITTTKQLMKLEKQFFISMAQQPLGGLGRLIIDASRSHSDTSQSVGLLWRGDQSDAETST